MTSGVAEPDASQTQFMCHRVDVRPTRPYAHNANDQMEAIL